MKSPSTSTSDKAVECLERAPSVVVVGDGHNGLSAHQEVELTAEERLAEKRFKLKTDIMILPFLAIMLFLASLDRSDVGNAAVAGMDKELNMTPADLSNCIAFFYIGFMIFQLPASLLLRVVQPPLLMGMAIVGWGVATTLMSEARNWQTIAGLRVVVGCFEAFVQGAPLYLTFWYKPNELATRGAIFMAVSTIGASMNGLIAYAIQTTVAGKDGRSAWRWLFLVEGVVPIGFGVIFALCLPNTPERVKRGFSVKEKEIALRRTKEAYNIPNTVPKLAQLLAAVKDKKTWFYCVLNACSSISQAAWGQFLPVIIKQAGYTDQETQLMTVPVFVAAGVVTITLGYFSDKFRARGPVICACFVVTATGWLLLLVSKNQQLSYAATYLIGAGLSPTIILEMTWVNHNVIGYTKKASALSIMNIAGQIMALVATLSFRDGPTYYIGKGLALGSAVLGAVMALVFMAYLTRLNNRKLANKESPEAEELRGKSVEEVYDDHPDFMYTR